MLKGSVFKVAVIIESILDISKFGKAYSGKAKFKKEPSIALQDTDISTKVRNENEGVFNLIAKFECCYSLNYLANRTPVKTESGAVIKIWMKSICLAAIY